MRIGWNLNYSGVGTSKHVLSHFSRSNFGLSRWLVESFVQRMVAVGLCLSGLNLWMIWWTWQHGFSNDRMVVTIIARNERSPHVMIMRWISSACRRGLIKGLLKVKSVQKEDVAAPMALEDKKLIGVNIGKCS